MLQVGDKAPNFKLPTNEGNVVELSELRGKKVVLYFYPKDNTPGCTREACDFRDLHTNFEKKGVTVLGISKDSQKSHQKFIEKYSLPFTLLVDEHGEVCDLYGVFKPKSIFGKTFLGINRTTFLINENGIIEAIWRKVKVPGHVEQVLNDIQ